jgi:DNA adenine methylase
MRSQRLLRLESARTAVIDGRVTATSRSSKLEAPVRPVLKWAGGKRQLLPQLRRFVPPSFEGYHEPFLGSGAVFLDLYASGMLDSRSVVLSDSNADLIGCYAAIAHNVELVIRELRKLAVAHGAGGDQHYYQIRDQRFNPRRRHASAERARYPASLAAMFIYLNRTGFNGLYRLNASGDFNVPVGRYNKPLICDTVNLRAVARALRVSNVEVKQSEFEEAVSSCRPGDLVYLDPPYAPLSQTSSFTSYTSQRFSDFDQRRLQRVVVDLAHRGCFVILSNSTAPIITELFDGNRIAQQAGLRAHRVPARRSINSNASGRGAVEEYIITNVVPSA